MIIIAAHAVREPSTICPLPQCRGSGEASDVDHAKVNDFEQPAQHAVRQ